MKFYAKLNFKFVLSIHIVLLNLRVLKSINEYFQQHSIGICRQIRLSVKKSLLDVQINRATGFNQNRNQNSEFYGPQ